MPIFKIFFRKEPQPASQPAPKPPEPICPSFDEEPWKSRAAALRPPVLDEYIFNLDKGESPNPHFMTPPPIPLGHPYVRLISEFLDTVPDECWIDEENDVD